MKKVFVVVYRDDTNDADEVVGVFVRREDAVSALRAKRDEVKRSLGDVAAFDSEWNGDSFWGIGYYGTNYDTCEIFETELKD